MSKGLDDADAESRPDVDWGTLYRSENEYSFDMLEDDNTTRTVELIKRIDQKKIHLESTKKREWHMLTQTLMSKTNSQTTLRQHKNPQNKTIQNTVQHCHKGNNNEKQITTTTKRDQSTNTREMYKNSSGFQHEKGDSKKWTETNLY